MIRNYYKRESKSRVSSMGGLRVVEKKRFGRSKGKMSWQIGTTCSRGRGITEASNFVCREEEVDLPVVRDLQPYVGAEFDDVN